MTATSLLYFQHYTCPKVASAVKDAGFLNTRDQLLQNLETIDRNHSVIR